MARKVTDPNEIDNMVEVWHNDGIETIPLHEVLGWTWEEYAHWVETNEPPASQQTEEER